MRHVSAAEVVAEQHVVSGGRGLMVWRHAHALRLTPHQTWLGHHMSVKLLILVMNNIMPVYMSVKYRQQHTGLSCPSPNCVLHLECLGDGGRNLAGGNT